MARSKKEQIKEIRQMINDLFFACADAFEGDKDTPVSKLWYGKPLYELLDLIKEHQAEDQEEQVSDSRRVKDSTDWYYFDKFEPIEDKYLPRSGEGETMANQVVTAVLKLVYKWFNDGDVYDNQYALEGWANDLSSYANWLVRYADAEDILDGIFNVRTEDEYVDQILRPLADRYLNEELLAEYADKPKEGSIYKCYGDYAFVDREDEDEEEGWEERYDEQDEDGWEEGGW